MSGLRLRGFGTAIDTAKVHGGKAYNVYLDFTLTRAGPDQWSATGSLMFTDALTGSSKVNVGTSSLDALFSADHKNGNALTGGEVKGSVVPAPAAVLLGLVGLAAGGWYMRRLA